MKKIIFVLFFILILSSFCYGANYTSTTVRVDKETLFNTLYDYCGFSSRSFKDSGHQSNFNTFYNGSLWKSDQVLTAFNFSSNGSEMSFFVYWSNTNKSGTFTNTVGGNKYVPTNYCQIYKASNRNDLQVFTGSYSSGTSLDSSNFSIKYFLIQDNNGWKVYDQNFNFNVSALTSFHFTPNYDTYITVFDDSSSSQFYKLARSKSVRAWKIGNISDISNFWRIQGYFLMYTPTGFYQEIGEFTYVNGSKLNGSISIDSVGDIYVNSPNIIYNQGYAVYFSYQVENGDEVSESQVFNYYFVPYGSTATSGDLINPAQEDFYDIDQLRYMDYVWEEVEQNGSGDINYVIDNNIFNPLFSGDIVIGNIFSGDFFGGSFTSLAGNMGFSDEYDSHGYDAFIYRLYRRIINLLYNDTSNQTLTISYRGYTTTLYGSDFKLPDSPLTTFVRLVLYAGFVMLFYQQMRFIWVTIVTLDLFGTIRMTEHPHTFFM